MPARRERPDEHAVVGRVAGHADAIAEDRAARVRARRIDRDDADSMPARAVRFDEAIAEGRLAGARVARHPEHPGLARVRPERLEELAARGRPRRRRAASRGRSPEARPRARASTRSEFGSTSPSHDRHCSAASFCATAPRSIGPVGDRERLAVRFARGLRLLLAHERVPERRPARGPVRELLGGLRAERASARVPRGRVARLGSRGRAASGPRDRVPTPSGRPRARGRCRPSGRGCRPRAASPPRCSATIFSRRLARPRAHRPGGPLASATLPDRTRAATLPGSLLTATSAASFAAARLPAARCCRPSASQASANEGRSRVARSKRAVLSAPGASASPELVERVGVAGVERQSLSQLGDPFVLLSGFRQDAAQGDVRIFPVAANADRASQRRLRVGRLELELVRASLGNLRVVRRRVLRERGRRFGQRLGRPLPTEIRDARAGVALGRGHGLGSGALAALELFARGHGARQVMAVCVGPRNFQPEQRGDLRTRRANREAPPELGYRLLPMARAPERSSERERGPGIPGSRPRGGTQRLELRLLSAGPTGPCEVPGQNRKKRNHREGRKRRPRPSPQGSRAGPSSPQKRPDRAQTERPERLQRQTCKRRMAHVRSRSRTS